LVDIIICFEVIENIQVLCNLIGNPVKIRDGPAAVNPHLLKKGLFQPLYATVPLFGPFHETGPDGMGRLLKKRRSQKTCLNKIGYSPWTDCFICFFDLVDKKGKSLGRP